MKLEMITTLGRFSALCDKNEHYNKANARQIRGEAFEPSQDFFRGGPVVYVSEIGNIKKLGEVLGGLYIKGAELTLAYLSTGVSSSEEELSEVCGLLPAAEKVSIGLSTSRKLPKQVFSAELFIKLRGNARITIIGEEKDEPSDI